MSSTATATGGGKSKFPFTATQWQELENQALVFKYMAAGIPIPPDLLFTIKRSLDSSLSSKLFPYQTSPLGWNPYQMGYGKKIDPEPGRCRRTDGKKWRCSKEAYPDSKYCERHMHRGKNRSRKPVESPLTTTTTTSNPNLNNINITNLHNNNNNNNNNNNSSNNNNSATNSSLTVAAAASLTNQSLLTKNPSAASTTLFSLPSSDSSCNSHLLYPHASSYNHKDYTRERYYQGIKEEVGEHAFFTESSGSSMRGFTGSSIDENWQIGNLDHHHHSKQSGGYPNYLQQQHQSNSNNSGSAKQQEKQCYIWGRDFNCDLSMKVEDDRDEKTTHHFFDEWPIKGGGRGGRDSPWHDSSTTQLSISIPASSAIHHHDFFLSNSRDP